MSYTIDEHKHISAAWGAATGARASKLCRFPVMAGKMILEASGFTPSFAVSHLPLPPDLDAQHAKWRLAVIHQAGKQNLRFTHGIAAKLINGYLKDRFVCGGDHEHDRVKYLHPPIDAVLLNELARADFGGYAKRWREFHDLRWSKFDSETYQSVISLLRQSLPAGEPLWTVEVHWRGYQ